MRNSRKTWNASTAPVLGLINDVLDISKIEAGAMDIYLETFAVELMIKDVATTMRWWRRTPTP
jgi:signal transduction histidine kinase